jgi:hypothetical protein
MGAKDADILRNHLFIVQNFARELRATGIENDCLCSPGKPRTGWLAVMQLTIAAARCPEALDQLGEVIWGRSRFYEEKKLARRWPLKSIESSILSVCPGRN